MSERPSYFREALFHPLHKALFTAMLIALVAGVTRPSLLPFFFGIAALEVLCLLVLPMTPGFRRQVDEEHQRDLDQRRANELERIADKLTPNAKARLSSVTRLRTKILDQLRAMQEGSALEREWGPRLDGIVNAALRILVAVDATRADDRELAFIDSEIQTLEADLAKASEGPARAAKQQKLELTKKRRASFGMTREQREAAILQLDTLEDLLEDLSAKGIAGRDAATFAKQLDTLSAQIDAAGESVAALDQHAAISAELGRPRASLK